LLQRSIMSVKEVSEPFIPATVYSLQYPGKRKCSKSTLGQGKRRPMTRPQDRLRRARLDAGYASAADAARAFGWNVNTYSSNENGNAPFSKTASVRYARAFRVELDWLVTGNGPMKKPKRGVPVVGHVGAGAVVFPIDNGVLDTVEPPFSTPENAVAVIVRGDSMLPAYRNGTYLILQPLDDPAEAIHRRAVVTLEDGSRLVKEVERGLSPGHFNLVSYNASPIRDVVIVQAARVLGTVEP
jgi:phage repressor protein C with HTH and peptisase S24 domain